MSDKNEYAEGLQMIAGFAATFTDLGHVPTVDDMRVIEKTCAAYLADAPASEWVSVNERMPDFGVSVLVRLRPHGTGGNAGLCIATFCPSSGDDSLPWECECGGGSMTIESVTHWMPLPEFPDVTP